jgi:hypothetical protein
MALLLGDDFVYAHGSRRAGITVRESKHEN